MPKSKVRSAAGKADWRKSLGLHPDFPLNRHPAGYWCKRVRGKLHYFGRMADDPRGEKALGEWERVKSDLIAGRKPRPKGDGLTVADLGNRFMTTKDRQLAAGELSKRMRDDYFVVCQRIVKQFGGHRLVADLAADDFELLRAVIKGGAHYRANIVQRTRTVFKYAYDNGLIDQPVRYGSAFKKPSKRTMRLARAEKGPKLFSAAELRRILAGADVHLRAMIYLALNCAYGNSDCGTLPLDALDLDGGWITYHRRKTGIPRRCPLWPQTVRALRRSLAKRPKHKSDEAERLVFVTKYGAPWAKETVDNPVTKEFRKLLDALNLHRPGAGFYALRHVFRTVADGAKDQAAARAIMGHADESIDGICIEPPPDDARLRTVVTHVRAWLVAGRKAVKRG